MNDPTVSDLVPTKDNSRLNGYPTGIYPYKVYHIYRVFI
jgi:hypothetical protein